MTINVTLFSALFSQCVISMSWDPCMIDNLMYLEYSLEGIAQARRFFTTVDLYQYYILLYVFVYIHNAGRRTVWPC